MKQRNVNPILLWIVKLTGLIPALLFLKLKVIYADKKKQSRKLPKGCILMSNHRSLMDFVLYLILFYKEKGVKLSCKGMICRVLAKC